MRSKEVTGRMQGARCLSACYHRTLAPEDLEERGAADMPPALALIHHLAIGLSATGHDRVVFRAGRTPVSNRGGYSPRYTQVDFEAKLSAFFGFQSVTRILNSDRTLYVMFGKLPC